MKHPIVVLLTMFALGSSGIAQADEKFEHVAVRVEQNATDQDFEVVFEATSGDTGLATLKVAAPDGRAVIDFKSPGTKLGMRSLRLESPEPKSLNGLQVDFPEGAYAFTASTVTGVNLIGTATLSHKLPGIATFVRPRPDEKNVPVKDLQIRWTADKNLASSVITIEHEETGVKVIQATLSGAATSFRVPGSLLMQGTKYKIAIGTVAKEGNASFVETDFTTARK